MTTKELKEKAIHAVEESTADLILFLQKLLTLPSTMGEEEGAQQYFAQLLQQLDAEVDSWVPSSEEMEINPNFLAARKDYAGSPNVVGVVKGSGGGKSLMINGHIDVVPEGDNSWNLSPWSGAVIDERIYGRGACDMKGGLVAGLIAMKAIKDADITLKGDVYIASVIGEETGGAGTLSLISRGYRADGAIVPEPTDMYVCPVNLGAIWFRIKVKGIAGHAATAANGINAVHIAAHIIKRIEELEEQRKTTVGHPMYAHSENPFCISIGSIHGGIFPTSIPDEVTMEGRLGYSPDEDLSEVKAVFEQAVIDVGIAQNLPAELLPEVEWFGFSITSGGAGKEHPIVAAVAENYRHVLNKEPVLRGTPWGTDAGALSKFGNTPSMIFGPGPGCMAHKANEYVSIPDLVDVAKIIACTMIDWCN